ncbi:MAG: hypothetical protein JWR26_1612 [Pedosphaera sp.]|nr:hypothetical protein [Pedosphaera sp.]
MKVSIALILICASLGALGVLAGQESADDWKSGSVSYKLKESGGSSGTISYQTTVSVSSGIMVVSARKRTDWANESQLEKPHDIHEIDDVITVALRDIDPGNFGVTKDTSGTPTFWEVHVNSARKNAVRSVSKRDGKDSTSKDGETFIIRYDNADMAMKAVEEIRVLARQAALPKK